jgi:MFS family permease
MELSVFEIAAPKSPKNRAARLLLLKTFTLETLGSIGGNLLMFGIFFYMQKRFAWGASKNLPFSSAQGVAYVIGALVANPLSRKIDRRKLLRLIHIGMATIAFAAAFAPTPAAIVALLLAYTFFSAVQWPLLESLISIGVGPRELSRRISIYNLVWSGSGAITVAACGLLIAHVPRGIFLATVFAHAIAILMLLRIRPQPHHTSTAQLHPEPELIPLRAQAKRLSRIALPATFAVIYALGAIMPTLQVIQSTTPTARTLLASVWMISRWFCFVFLGLTVWWHTRPRALLLAAAVLLAAFLAITLIPETLSMILWQIALGIAMALIYSASLYFGMVLSDGSTAQNAYHEALIGLGSILGPGCGALAANLRPGDSLASIYAVAAILWISVLAACAVSLQSKRQSPI